MPEQLTRELLEDYRAHVRALPYSVKHKHTLIGAMKVLLDEVRANGWAPRLPMTAAYYKGEIPVTSKALPRAIDEFVMRQIEAPGEHRAAPESDHAQRRDSADQDGAADDRRDPAAA